MPIQLKQVLQETLADWHKDLAPAWQPFLAEIELGFSDIDETLMIESWEPVFPARRHKTFPGAPADAHILHAFDGLTPGDVRCVILGQDPYPCPAFSTGRAFEAGNVAEWRELNKMFSKSVRAFVQLIVAARTGEAAYAEDFDRWPEVLTGIESGNIELERPAALADHWVRSGVLLLNSSLTLSRFKVDIDEHQSKGHSPLWRPLIVAVLHHLVSLGSPIVYICFGDAAAQTLALAGLSENTAPEHSLVILRDHPAFAENVLGRVNPFVVCNKFLEHAGNQPVAW